jgi:hypothetical protein
MLCEQAEMGDVAIDGSRGSVHELEKVAEVIGSLLERIFWIVFFAEALRDPEEVRARRQRCRVSGFVQQAGDGDAVEAA